MRSPLGKIGALSQKINPLGVLAQNHRHAVSDPPRNTSQVIAGQNSSPATPSDRPARVKSSRKNELNNVSSEISAYPKGNEHRIDIGDESSDLLGQLLLSGKLVPDKIKSGSGHNDQYSKSKESKAEVDAKLTIKAFIWGSHFLDLSDIISVSYSEGVRRFTVHSCAMVKKTWVPFGKSQRKQKDLHFLASSPEDALRWVNTFADLQLFVNCLPHPLLSSKQGPTMDARDFAPGEAVKCKSPPVMLVILNPRSGRGRSSKVFYGKVEPIFKLAGFKFEVVETTCAGHARKLASQVDLSRCPDGIICVGGDGIINEVLNGLINREDPKEAMAIPIGIIPAGSDNSLVWTVLGVRDPISASLAIVKGGLTATDVFAVEWIQTGSLHAGHTVAYYGFVSDVLELSEKFQKRFGPLRYFVAGALKVLCLPKYEYEVEYLPVTEPNTNIGVNQASTIDASENQSDKFGRKSNIEGLPRASSLSSIDSILTTPNRISGDFDMITGSTYASSEPSEYVRALDAKTKRLSSGRNNLPPEPEEVVHPSLPGAATPTRPRTRNKSRSDKGWTGLGTLNVNDNTRSSWGNTMVVDREDISSTMSDPGPIWDAEARWDTGPKWDMEPKWDAENNFDVKGSIDEMLAVSNQEVQKIEEEKWVSRKGRFLGVLICNHQCKTVQNLSSQVLAPRAEHDDTTLDLLLVHGGGRLKLLRFFVLMQFGRHLTLPFVEYTKVKSVRLRPGKKNVHQGCGIDGELKALDGPISTSLLPEQCKLIGRPARHSA